jgi:hypothetical protein
MKKNISIALIVGAMLIIGYLFISGDSPALNDTAGSGSQHTGAITAAEFEAGTTAKQAQFEAQDPEFPDDEKILYEINPDGSTTPELHPADAELWDMVRTLAPTQEVFDSIVTFEVYFDESDDTLASVESQDDTNATWLYSINYIAVDEFEELVPTIVHEFAHILGLRDEQTTTEAEDEHIRETCENYLVDEGCLNDGSHLDNYYKRFWEGNPAFQENDRTAEEAEIFFAAHPGEYVSDYATTNPVEGFAESFMFYTVKDPLDTSTIKGQKTSFFDDIESLRAYRAKARQTVSSWAQ